MMAIEAMACGTPTADDAWWIARGGRLWLACALRRSELRNIEPYGAALRQGALRERLAKRALWVEAVWVGVAKRTLSNLSVRLPSAFGIEDDPLDCRVHRFS